MSAKKTTPARTKKPATKKATPRPRTRKHSGPQAAPATKPAAKEIAPPTSTAPKGFIVVDGSNVANSSRREGMPRLENIQRVHDLLVQEGYEPVIFVDASLRHQIPDAEAKLFSKWEGDGFIVQVPRGVNGDEAVLEFASRRNAPVLSNDNYQDLEERYPWVRDRTRRIPYNLVRGELILYRYNEPAPPAAPAEPSPSSAPAPTMTRPREGGRGREPSRQRPQPASPAPAAPNPAQPPAPPASTPPAAVPLQEKHRNFRKPRPPPQQTPLLRTPSQANRPAPRPEPEPEQEEAFHQPRGGRNQHIPRATEEEKAMLKQTLIKLFEEKVPPGGSIRADQLSEETRRAIPGFRPNYYGSSSFTKLLDRMDDVFELARRGPEGQMASLEGPQRWPIVVLRRGPV